MILAYHCRENTKHDEDEDVQEEADDDHHHDHDDNRTQPNTTRMTTPTITTTNARIKYLPLPSSTYEKKPKTFHALTSLFIDGPPSKHSPSLAEPFTCFESVASKWPWWTAIFSSRCSQVWIFIAIRTDKMNTNNLRWLDNSLKIL